MELQMARLMMLMGYREIASSGEKVGELDECLQTHPCRLPLPKLMNTLSWLNALSSWCYGTRRGPKNDQHAFEPFSRETTRERCLINVVHLDVTVNKRTRTMFRSIRIQITVIACLGQQSENVQYSRRNQTDSSTDTKLD
jgi:hypothetical protein